MLPTTSLKPLTHTARLPMGYVAEFTFGPGDNLSIVWKPSAPVIHDARRRRRFTHAYRQARDAFLLTVAAARGEPVLIADGLGATVLSPHALSP